MSERLILGFSTSVLFDMAEPRAVFEACGVEGYHKYMLDKVDEPLPLGEGFQFYKSISHHPDLKTILCSQNSALTGLRAMRTLHKENALPYGSFFTNGASPVPYLKAHETDIFLTADEHFAHEAQRLGITSSIHRHSQSKVDQDVVDAYRDGLRGQLKSSFNAQAYTHFVFDLDCVLFDSESEDYYRENGLELYRQHELNFCDKPLNKGAFYDAFVKLNHINSLTQSELKPFKISVVTARGAEATLRALNTLHDWGVDLTGEIHFMDGVSKGPVLGAIKEKSPASTVFFDDQEKNVQAAEQAGLFAGRVPVLT